MHYFNVKVFLTVIAIFYLFSLSAQKLIVSEPISILNDESYAFSPKINDRFLFFSWHAEFLSVNSLDNGLRSVWQKDITIEKKYDVKILDVVANKLSFCVVARLRKKGNNFIKVLKYDGQAKLLDSATVCFWKEQLNDPELETFQSDDKRVMMVLNPGYFNDSQAVAFSLDSLKPIWNIKWKAKSDYDDHFKQWLITNEGKAFLFNEEPGPTRKQKQFDVLVFNNSQSVGNFKITTGELYTTHALFSFDNRNKKLISVGGYSNKNNFRINGIFYLSIPEINTTQAVWQITPFTDDFATSFTGRKVTDNKGLEDLKVQQIINRSDGGVIAFVEKIRTADRTAGSSSPFGGVGGSRIYHAVDYYYDNMFSISLDSAGNKEWSQVYVKHQVSQDDEGRYSSFYVMRTPSALRLIFNEDVARNTNVYDFTIKNGGEIDRHVVLNTEAKDLYLRFRDALQIGSNEILIPSEGSKNIKLVKIQW